MNDPRYAKLADLLINYSCDLQEGEHILLDLVDVPDEMGVALIRAARKAGGTPLAEVRHSRLNRELVRGTDEAHAKTVRDIELARFA